MEEMSTNRLVSIIIVSNGKDNYLKSCLESLKVQTYPEFETIVIDNSLNHNFSQEILKCYPGIKLYSSVKNLFYCSAVNKGIEVSKGNFILCLNDDVILDKSFIEEALKGFLVEPKIGMVGGKILRQDAQTLDSTGLFLSPWRTTKDRGYGVRDTGQYEKEGYVFGVNGAVAFYRREMLEDIKVDPDYFDADYHIFYEDLDIAWRGQNFGWKAYYVPSAVAYHIRGASVRLIHGINKPCARRYLSDDLHLDLVKNRYLTLIKNESLLDFVLRLLFIFFYDILTWGYILFFRPRLVKNFLLNLKIIKFAFIKRKLIKKIEFSRR